MLHALRDCPQVRSVWWQLGVRNSNQNFWRSDLQEWLALNGKGGSRAMYGRDQWSVFFSFAIWLIWKRRNQMVFTGRRQHPNLVFDIVNKTMEFIYCASSPRNLTRSGVITCRWERPPKGWMKLNTDGCAAGSPGLAGCGGVVRDSNGEWVSGFSRLIGTTNSFVAELWGLRDGLILCSNLNIQSLIVELDAKSVVDIFGNSVYVNDGLSPILDDCRMLITRFQ